MREKAKKEMEDNGGWTKEGRRDGGRERGRERGEDCGGSLLR